MKLKFNKSVFLKIFIITISIVGIFFLTIWGYRQYKELKSPLFPALNAIPNNTALFIEIRDCNQLWNNLNQPYSIWNTLTEINSFNEINKQIIFLDSLTKSNPEIKKIINSQPIYIAITYTPSNEFSSIFLIDLSDKQQSKIILKFIKNYQQGDYKNIDLSKDEIPLFQISSIKSGKKLYYSLLKGVFIAGKNMNEVIASANQLNNNKPITDNLVFNKIYNSAGKNVDANFYFNLTYIQKLFSKIFNQNNTFFSLLQNIKNGWIALDMKIKENLFLLNGFTDNSDTTINLFNLFKNEEPQTINTTNILPDNTSMFLYLGYHDFNKFGKSLTNLNDSILNKNKIKDFNAQYNIEIEKYFKYWVGNEIVIFSTPKQSNVNDTYNYFAINSIDTKTATDRLSELTNKISLKTSNENSVYKNYPINQINISDILESFFGFMAKNIQAKFYTIINNYVIFGNSREALEQYIDKIKLKQTLINNSTYNSFTENLSDKASIYLYINIPLFLETFTKYLNLESKNIVEKNLKIFDQLQSFGLQIIPRNELFYNTICFNYKTISINKPASILWQLDLDTIIYGKPTVLKNYSNKSNEILISDAANQLYLIDKDGKVIWKKPVDGKIMSNIYLIDYYNNGRLQFLFNTEKYIYLMDHNGKNIENFPVKLKSNATNGLLAVYYPDINDYRIYLACENKRIICLSKNASLVDGWQFKNTQYIVEKPIQHFIINNTDYLVFYDNTGKIFIIDRKGIFKIKLNKNLVISEKNTITLNKNINNNEINFVFTNKKGEIISIQIPNGNITTFKIKDYSPDHYFLYADINNDKKKEYIFIDNTNLEIYNLSQKLIYNYKFANPINSAPLLIDDKNQIIKFGVINNFTSELYLFSYFNNSYTLKETLPCTFPFMASHLTNNQQLNILTGSNNTLYNYIF